MPDEQNLLQPEKNMQNEVPPRVVEQSRSPEQYKVPEIPKMPEATEISVQQEQAQVKEVQEAPSTAPVPAASVPKDPILKEIEDILAQDLGEMYAALPQEKKIAFKAKGEEIATTVQTMFETGKVRVKKIIDLIRSWLRMIPGVNRYFVEQESKIKADRLVKSFESKKGV